MNNINRKVMTIFALVLCLSVTVGVSLAYFSDYEDASGGAKINLGGKTELTEGDDHAKKDIKIKNNGKTNMIVRVAIYGADEYMNLNVPDDWKKAGDFYYYQKILKGVDGDKPGDKTSTLVANVKQSWVGSTPPAFDYEVTVVHESAQAVFDGKELAVPAGWDGNAVGSIAIPQVQKGVN